jgi:hypothetical protein
MAQTASNSSVLGLQRTGQVAGRPSAGVWISRHVRDPHAKEAGARQSERNMSASPHQQKPDKDNRGKSFADAVFGEDSHVWDGRVTKIRGETGQIIIEGMR